MKPSFAQLQLHPELLRTLRTVGYLDPTPIQVEAIPATLAGRDLMGCAQTGTGKTAAFALPILHRLATEPRRAVPNAPRVLVLSPTRELAAQIATSFATYGQNLKLRQAVVYGGVGQNPQVRALRHGIHLLVATPGRLLDLMDQGHIRLNGLDVFVLDEADRMLDMGFLPDLRRIIQRLPKQRQSLFFSATMSSEIRKLAATLLRDPVGIDIAPTKATTPQIHQQVMHVNRAGKSAALGKVLDSPGVDRVLVFTRTKRGADRLAKQLHAQGTRAEAIHGNKSQNARTRTLDSFKARHFRVLVATDLAARGIDVDGITHVINYDLPQEPESYIHRIGRTGRAGASGSAFTFCDPEERDLLRSVEKLLAKSIPVHEDYPAPQLRAKPSGRRPPPPRRRATARGKFATASRQQ